MIDEENNTSEAFPDEEHGSHTSPVKSLPGSRISESKSNVEKSGPDVSEPLPDGGFKGWRCALGGFFALFCTFGWLNSLGLFQTYYQEILLSTYSASAISWIFTVQLFFMWAGGGIFGPIIDTYGTHYVAIPCAFILTFSVTMLSLCTQYYQIFFAQGVGFGIAASGLFCCATTSTGQWFHKRKGLALGVVLAGSSTGGVIHSVYLHILISKAGFPSAARWSALVIGISSTISCCLMRARLPRKQWDPKQNFIDLSLFRQRKFAVYSTGTFMAILGLFAPWDYLPDMSITHSFSPSLSIYTIVILNGASILGRVLPAHIADRFGNNGRINSLIAISFLTSALLLAFWLPLELTSSTHVSIFAFSACYGFASGAFISLMMPCVAELGPVESTGRRFGTYQVVVGVASLTGLPIQGALIPQDKGGFAHLIIFSGVCILLGSVFIGAARMLKFKDSTCK